jgi:A/G-specific adenine glycosylase
MASLLAWYRRVARDLPWRRTRDPYAIWVSETMLQQTRVDTVTPYYERFLGELPTLQSLAEAPEERVLGLWSGLGYYRRARMLHAAARRVVREHGGRLPQEAQQLRSLEGVGAYTAGAVSSIAFGRREALVDGNVARVLARLFALDDVASTGGKAHVWRLAETLVKDAPGEPGDWNQALMELGATVCTPREPRCSGCPVSAACLAQARGIAGELPRASARREPLTVRRVALVLASSSRVLLARRRPGALFGGLWEPPGTDGGAPELTRLARRLGLDPRSLEPVGEVRHVLTHRRLHVAVARGSLGRKRRWAVPSAEYDAIEAVARVDLAELAQARLSRKLLALAGVL